MRPRLLGCGTVRGLQAGGGLPPTPAFGVSPMTEPTICRSLPGPVGRQDLGHPGRWSWGPGHCGLMLCQSRSRSGAPGPGRRPVVPPRGSILPHLPALGLAAVAGSGPRKNRGQRSRADVSVMGFLGDLRAASCFHAGPSRLRPPGGSPSGGESAAPSVVPPALR